MEWEAEDDVKGGLCRRHTRSKLPVTKEIQYLWDRKVYEYAKGTSTAPHVGIQVEL